MPFPVTFPDHSQQLTSPHPSTFNQSPGAVVDSQAAQFNPRSNSIQTGFPTGTTPPAPVPSSASPGNAYRSSSPVASFNHPGTPRRKKSTNPFLDPPGADFPPADLLKRPSTPHQALQSPLGPFPGTQIESPAPVYPTAHETGPAFVAPSRQPQSPGISRQNSASIQKQNSASPSAFRNLARQDSASPTAFAAAQFQDTPANPHRSPSPVAFEQPPGTPRHAPAQTPFGQPLAPVATRVLGRREPAAKSGFTTGQDIGFGADPFAG